MVAADSGAVFSLIIPCYSLFRVGRSHAVTINYL